MKGFCISRASVGMLVLAAFCGAELCDELAPTGIGQFAPKYPKSGAEGSCDAGVYTMTAYGHDYYWGWDRGGFSYYTVSGSDDFSFTARIVSDASDFYVQNEKVGICVREGLLGNERAVQLRWDGFFGGNAANAQISWLYRFAPGIATSEFCSNVDRFSCFKEGGTDVTDPKDVVLKVERVAMKYKLYVNGTQVASDQNIALQAASGAVHVGLMASFGGGEAPVTLTAKFDQISCTGADCTGTSLRTVRPGEKVTTWSAALSGTRLTMTAPAPADLRGVRSVDLYNAGGRMVARMLPAAQRDGTTLQLDNGKPLDSGIHFATLRLEGGMARVIPTTAIR